MALSQKANIGKPPERQRPPQTFMGGMRRIVYTEQPQPSNHPEIYGVSKTHPWSEAEFELHTGLDITLPEGAKIVGVARTEKGYELSYEWLQTMTAPGKYEGEVYARVGREAPYPQFLEAPSTTTKITREERYGLDLSSVTYERERHVVDVKDLWAIGKAGDAASLKGAAQLYGQELIGVPKEALITKITPQEVSYTMPSIAEVPKPLTEWEVWFGKTTPAQLPIDVISSLAFRNLWDVGYKQELAERPTLTAEQRVIASRERSRQMEIGASIALISWAAFDIARGAYTIWKGRSTLKEPITIMEHGEGVPENFQITRVSGAKGMRVFETTAITPTEQSIAEDFKITWTRGIPTTPMKTTLDKLLKDTKGSTTLQELLFLKPATVVSDVPMAAYVPRQIGEFAFTGMAVGQLSSQMSHAPVLVQPTKLMRLQRATVSLAGARSTASISQALLPATMMQLEPGSATVQIQRTGQLQGQRQLQQSLQRQMQLQKQTFSDDWLMPKGKRKRGKDDFGLWSRYKRFYPVMTGQEVMKIDRKKVKFL